MSLRSLLLMTLTLVWPLLAGASQAPARIDGKIGGEWTFTDGTAIGIMREGLGTAPTREFNHKSALVQKWLEIIAAKCPTCRISGRVVWITDGFSFTIGNDIGVIEVTADAKLTSEYDDESLRTAIQDLVWDSAREAGLAPHWRIGGGHIHFDLDTHFAGNALLFRNFIVDLMNHPELFMGALGLDYLNAPPLAILGDEQRNAFEELLREFDQGGMSLMTFKSRMNHAVYTSTYVHGLPFVDRNPDKFQALNFLHFNTLEIRGVRPQENFEQFLLVAKLFQARLFQLAQIKEPIPYIRKDHSRLVSTKTVRLMEFYRTELDPDVIMASYRDYVTAAKLDWDSYKTLVTKELKMRMRKQERATAFSRSNGPSTCEAVFTMH